MKKSQLALGTLLLALCACASTPAGTSSASSLSEDTNMKQLLTDTHFENGFDLLTTSTENGRALSGTLNYGGEAKTPAAWQMSQWWTPYDFIDSKLEKQGDGKYRYSNESRSCVIDTKEGSFEMNLNSNTEYQEKFGRTRTGNENWSHFLLEQSFKDPAKLSELEHLYVHLSYTLNKSVDMDPGQAVPCAQITWYFTITNVQNGDPTYESGSNDFFWFGLPFYDSRYDYVTGYKHVDSGFVGATNKLIYNIDAIEFLPAKTEVGKTIEIDVDILPYIQDAFLYGIQNGAMAGSVWQDLWVNYMNLGWELPGAYDVSITLKGLSIKAEYKGEAK